LPIQCHILTQPQMQHRHDMDYAEYVSENAYHLEETVIQRLVAIKRGAPLDKPGSRVLRSHNMNADDNLDVLDQLASESEPALDPFLINEKKRNRPEEEQEPGKKSRYKRERYRGRFVPGPPKDGSKRQKQEEDQEDSISDSTLVVEYIDQAPPPPPAEKQPKAKKGRKPKKLAVEKIPKEKSLKKIAEEAEEQLKMEKGPISLLMHVKQTRPILDTGKVLVEAEHDVTTNGVRILWSKGNPLEEICGDNGTPQGRQKNWNIWLSNMKAESTMAEYKFVNGESTKDRICKVAKTRTTKKWSADLKESLHAKLMKLLNILKEGPTGESGAIYMAMEQGYGKGSVNDDIIPFLEEQFAAQRGSPFLIPPSTVAHLLKPSSSLSCRRSNLFGIKCQR
jgi:hypothetical protein